MKKDNRKTKAKKLSTQIRENVKKAKAQLMTELLEARVNKRILQLTNDEITEYWQ